MVSNIYLQFRSLFHKPTLCCVTVVVLLFFLFIPFSSASSNPAPASLNSGSEKQDSESIKQQKQGLILEIMGAIGPATEDYITRSLKFAEKNKMTFVIIRIDTPGGLDTAMRGINKAILASSIPVITYVAPAGARAASAGTYILYASAVAAMAPGTHLGAASPVMMGEIPNPGKDTDPIDRNEADNKTKPENKSNQSKKPSELANDNASTLSRKSMEDAVAYIRGLAALHGRNAEWAEKAVRQAVSLSAEEAYKMKVIDIVADNETNLIHDLNGRQVKVGNTSIMLETDNVELVNHPPDWRYQFLSIITDPNIAYILLLLGIYGLFFEFSNPGFILPGIVGAIALVLALYAFQLLPVNYAGFALLLLGMLFIILEAFVSSFGALGIGGVIAFTVGSIFLLDTESAGYGISWTLIIGMSVVTAGFLFIIASLAVRSFRRKVVTGVEGLIGQTGNVIQTDETDNADGNLMVRVEGEIWQATSAYPLKSGQKIIVKAVNGLQLTVAPLEGVSGSDLKS